MRLLSLTNKNYFLLAATLLLLSIPVFYFIIQGLLIHKMDEELLEHKNSFFESLRLIKDDNDLDFYKHFYEELSLNPIDYKIKKDSIFTMEAYDSAEAKVVPFRILRSGVYLLNQHYELIIRESLISTRELLLAIVSIKAAILAALLVGIVLFNRVLTKRIWSPFYKTLENLKKFELEGKDPLQLVESSINEFKDLNLAIVQLANRNRQAYLVQKEFTENAAHELQTPIAICRAKLELLMQSHDLTKEQADLIDSLYEATERILRLNKNLLLLTRIENRLFIDRENVNASHVVEHILAMHQQQTTAKRFVITCTVEPDVILNTSLALFEVLISNLISNAFRFTPEGGHIDIEMHGHEFIITNSGEPLEHSELLFERFYREGERNSIGSGLGLALVKSICSLESFKLSYSYKDLLHQFRLKFK